MTLVYGRFQSAALTHRPAACPASAWRSWLRLPAHPASCANIRADLSRTILNGSPLPASLALLPPAAFALPPFAFAVASLLSGLALVTLAVKALVEARARRAAP